MNACVLACRGIVLLCLGIFSSPSLTQSAGYAWAASTAPVICDGPNDLVVSSLTSLPATNRFDRLCVLNGGTLTFGRQRSSGSLVVGWLYVAAGGTISVAGSDGYGGTGGECDSGIYMFVGATAGNSLTITARHAVVAGTITASGGKGVDADTQGCGERNEAGTGERGGSISLTAHDLTLSGRISADGGVGGKAGRWFQDPVDPGAAGGGGGSVSVSLVTPLEPAAYAHLSANGGQGAVLTVAKGGKTAPNGTAGTVSVSTLPTSAAAQLPPEPPPSMTYLPGAAKPSILRAGAAPALTTTCTGSSDLRVATTLRANVGATGTQHYQHICILPGGRLIARADLTLMASSIYVAAGGSVSVDGDSPAATFTAPSSGMYADHAACTADEMAPHAGVDGFITAATASWEPVHPGGGAHSLALVAGTIVVDGRLSAVGGAGQVGVDDSPNGKGGPIAYIDAGSGSGGGVLLVSHDLTLGGTVSVAGGPGELLASPDPGFPASPGIANGSYGCIKIFSTRLRATNATLGLDGPAVVGTLTPATPLRADLLTTSAGTPTGPILTGVYQATVYALDQKGALYGSDGGQIWRPLWVGPSVTYTGPFGNPRLSAIAVLDQGRTLIVAASDCTVWHSDDYATTWREVARDTPMCAESGPGGSTLTAVGNTVYGSASNGIFVSRDAGATWQRLLRTPDYSDQGAQSAQVTGVVAAGTTPALWATTFDPDYTLTPAGLSLSIGLFASPDGGTTWQHMVTVPKGARNAIDDIAASRAAPSVLYGWNDTDTLLFAARDQGHSWTRLPLAASATGIIQGVSFDPNDARHLYARTETPSPFGDSNGQLFVSHDGGTTWKLLPAPKDIQSFYASSVRANRLYVTTALAVYQSNDDGATWQAWEGPDTRGASLAFVSGP